MAHHEETYSPVGLPGPGVTGLAPREGSDFLVTAGTSAETGPVEQTTRVSSPARDAWRRYRRNWAAMISLGVLIILIIMAVFAPFMHTSDPLGQDYNAISVGPSPTHWFGTNQDGSDLYSQLVYGLRVPLTVGLIGTLVTVVIGTLVGLAAGYFGGIVDSALSRLTDLFLAFPVFLLVLLSAVLFGHVLDPEFGGSGRVVVLTIVFALFSWPVLTRFVRSLALSLREGQYVEAARTCGSSNWKIIRRHLLPNMFGLILVQTALIAIGIVYIETTLSIFGLGIEPPNPDIGQILFYGSSQLELGVQPGIYSAVVFSSLLLILLLVSLTFIGDGVRDAYDPRGNA